MTYEFDWSDFTESTLRKINKAKFLDEDDIYGFLPVKTEDGIYLVDIHYYRYTAVDKGFDLEVYKSNKMMMHTAWLGSIKDIKSSTNYNNFCKRAEKLITEFLNSFLK